MYKIYRHGGNNINNQYCAVFYLRHKKGKALTLGFHSLLVKKVKNKPGFHSDKKKKKKCDPEIQRTPNLRRFTGHSPELQTREDVFLLTLAHLI